MADDEVDVPGVFSLFIFYLLILAVGIWSGMKAIDNHTAAGVYLANRNLGYYLTICTLTGR